MNPEDQVQFGTANLYCPTCKTTTQVRWYGKLIMRRCWRCDAMMEDHTDA